MKKPVALLTLTLALASTACQPEMITATHGTGTTGTATTGDSDTSTNDGDTSRSVLLHVASRDAAGIPKATVTIDGAIHFTDNAGFLRVDDPDDDFSARIDAAGYTSSAVKLELSDGLHLYQEVHLFPLGDPLPLDAELGGTVELDGVSVIFPPNALVKRFGEPVTGIVDVTITVLDPTQDDELQALPGPLEARTALDDDVLLLTLGMTEVSLWQQGHPIHLASNATATLTLAIPDALAGGVEVGQQIPAWSLDLDEGLWLEEDPGAVDLVDDQLVWTTEVSHFSWYNSDVPAQHEDFECYVVAIEDADGNPVSKGFSLVSPHDGGIFIDGGHSSQSETNMVSNCALAPIGTPPLPMTANIADFDYEIIGATGETNLCRENGIANPDCGLVKVTLPPQAPPLLCTPGSYETCPYTGSADTQGIGACEPGYDYCINDGTAWSGCVGEWTPQPESCLTLFDDDCDGASDDPDAVDCECMPGQTIPCYSGPLGTNNIGECVPGVRTCDPDTKEYIEGCVGEVTPLDEDCTTQYDEDCDGLGGCEPPEAPANVQLTFSQVKQFDFSWTQALGAQFYRLLEKNLGDPDYVQVGPPPMSTALSLTVPVLLHRRLGTTYIVQACNDFGCTDSDPVTVVGSMAEAIGYFKASNTNAGDQFGFSVALSGDGSTLAIGAPYEDSDMIGINGNLPNDSAVDAGAVYVFVRSQDGWSQQAYVKASNTDAGDRFGFSVALSGDGNTLAVGAYQEDSSAMGIGGNQADDSTSNVGAVYMFVRDGQNAWSQDAYIKASNAGLEDRFGLSVALSGDGNTMVAGAHLEDGSAAGVNGPPNNSKTNPGAAYVFVRGQNTWSQQAYVKASNPGASDYFGYSVALSGDGNTLAIGAYGESSSAVGINGNQADNSLKGGAVYVFVRDGMWTQQAYVKASNTGSLDHFGWSLALSDDGDTLAVSARMEDSSAVGIGGDAADNSAADSGAVYVFERGNSWTQQAYVKASNTGSGDDFGRSVTLSADGNTLAVGAYWEDSNATGLGGDPLDNSTSYSGAVYVYARDPMMLEWAAQPTYVKASNTSYQFGYDVALSGDGNTLAVGATGEGSSATGISGDQLDGSAGNAGAVYVY